MAIVAQEPTYKSCIGALSSDPRVLLSAGTAAEAMIVAYHRGLASEMASLIERVGIEIVPVTEAVSRRVAAAHAKWGKGVHPARLNFGDCFSYEVASHHACPLLFVGNDFARTDLASVLPTP